MRARNGALSYCVMAFGHPGPAARPNSASTRRQCQCGLHATAGSAMRVRFRRSVLGALNLRRCACGRATGRRPSHWPEMVGVLAVRVGVWRWQRRVVTTRSARFARATATWSARAASVPVMINGALAARALQVAVALAKRADLV